MYIVTPRFKFMSVLVQEHFAKVLAVQPNLYSTANGFAEISSDYCVINIISFVFTSAYQTILQLFDFT